MPLSGDRHGSGELLVFLHGLFGSGDNLRGVGRAFEADYTVLYPDLPNHGGSPHTNTFDYGLLGRAVADAVAAHGSGPCLLVGHSMGGKVAMRLALEQPQLIRALAVLDMAPRTYDRSHIEIMDALLGLPLAEIESRADADRRLAQEIPSSAVRSFLLKNLVREAGAWRWRLNLPVLRRDYDSVLGWDGEGTYEGPVLFIGGSASKYVKPDRDLELIRGHFPRARIEMIPDAGHWIHSERPDEVRTLLATFLEQVGGDRR